MDDMVLAKSKLSAEGTRLVVFRDWRVMVEVGGGEMRMSAWVPCSLTEPVIGMGSRWVSSSGRSGSRVRHCNVFIISGMWVVILG